MRSLIRVLSVSAIVVVAACSTTEAVKPQAAGSGNQSSPAQYGFSLGLTVPVVDAGPATVSGLGTYEYSSWDGGHDDVFSLGLQLRTPAGTGPWSIGGEAIYHRWICKSDPGAFCASSPAANGLGINGLVVRDLPNSPIAFWASAGPKWLTDFTNNGTFAFESGFGWHAKVGVELSIGN